MAGKDFVPYVNISARLQDKPDQGLLREIGARSFPTTVVMDTNGRVILRNDTAGPLRPDAEKRVRGAVEVASELVKARALAKSSEEGSEEAAAAKASVLLLEAIMGIQEPASSDLEKAVKTPGLSKELIERYQRWSSYQPINKLLQDYVRKVRALDSGDTNGRGLLYLETSREMLRLYRSGIRLNDARINLFSDYWRLVFDGAISAKDAAVAEVALATYRRAFGSRADLKPRINKMSSRLAALKVEQQEEQGGTEE